MAYGHKIIDDLNNEYRSFMDAGKSYKDRLDKDRASYVQESFDMAGFYFEGVTDKVVLCYEKYLKDRE